VNSPPNRAERRNWPKRRQWLDRIAADRRLTHGAKAWLILLARRSDDAGKPVWGNQKKMGAQIGRCDRSVRRYRLEAEELGYVKTYHAKPQHGPGGQITHQRTNTYYLCLPARQTASQPAPRRRERAPYCVVTAAKSRRHHRADSDDRVSPYGVNQTATHPPVGHERWVIIDPEPDIPPMTVDEARAHARLTRKNGRHLRTP
jgi:hypothetical protein